MNALVAEHGDANAALLQLLGERAEDPMVDALLKLSAARAASAESVPEDDGPLASLRERNDHLAAALGACARCWGEDTACRLCDGYGMPGAFAPDDHLFRWYVVPAARRVMRARRRARRPEGHPMEGAK